MATTSTQDPSGRIPKVLKSISPASFPSLHTSCRSDVLHPSQIPSSANARDFYLSRKQPRRLPAPMLSCSEFIPRNMVALLMREKKDGAIGVKSSRSDSITNMEGVLHTFVTPVISTVEIVGDYRYQNSHKVSEFRDVWASDDRGKKHKVRLVRCVVMSASIHMDFESSEVMLQACKLGEFECIGKDMAEVPYAGWDIPGLIHKQNARERSAYEEKLKKHLVFYLTVEGRLPARQEIDTSIMRLEDAVKFVEHVIVEDGTVDDKMIGEYVTLRNREVVSLELLFNTAIHQIRNEFSALEALCTRGYVYTYDPASIFAGQIGSTLLNRLTLAALRAISDANKLENMRIFAFNDYIEPNILRLVKRSLELQTEVRVVSKADLFRGPEGTYDLRDFEVAKGAMLVIHNNSDAFGQNIETENGFGSLDAAIGLNSSAAASLLRDRPDLLDYLV